MILLLFGASGYAQDRISLLSDFMYTRQHLPAYEEIKKETDPQKLAALLIEFLRERPINRLIPFIIQDYQIAIVGQLENQAWDRAIAMAEEMLSVLPTDQAIDRAVEEGDITIVESNVDDLKRQLQVARLAMRQVFLNAYFLSGNWAKAAEIQEQFYADAPSIQGAMLLADIYWRMQNFDKYLENARKIMAEFPLTQPQGFDAAYQSLQVHIQNNDIPAATELLRKLMDVYGDKIPDGLTAEQWNPLRIMAFSIFAQELFTARDFPKALELFERVLQIDPRNGDAYYFIGMCKWNIEGQDSAIEPFARSVVLNGAATAANARQRLEQIHKANNEDSLDGLDEVLAKAKADLGI
jgi:tetratricopeptide (TPR) repeat protein